MSTLTLQPPPSDARMLSPINVTTEASVPPRRVLRPNVRFPNGELETLAARENHIQDVMSLRGIALRTRATIQDLTRKLKQPLDAARRTELIKNLHGEQDYLKMVFFLLRNSLRSLGYKVK